MPLTYAELEASTSAMTEAELDAFIKWKAGDVSVLRAYRLDIIRGGVHMQRKFTVELRVDFADAEKLPAMKKVLQQVARHAYATAQLISDNSKLVQVAIFSDDFFSGHEDILLLDDTIAEGLAADPDTEDASLAEIAAALSK